MLVFAISWLSHYPTAQGLNAHEWEKTNTRIYVFYWELFQQQALRGHAWQVPLMPQIRRYVPLKFQVAFAWVTIPHTYHIFCTRMKYSHLPPPTRSKNTSPYHLNAGIQKSTTASYSGQFCRSFQNQTGEKWLEFPLLLPHPPSPSLATSSHPSPPSPFTLPPCTFLHCHSLAVEKVHFKISQKLFLNNILEILLKGQLHVFVLLFIIFRQLCSPCMSPSELKNNWKHAKLSANIYKTCTNIIAWMFFKLNI